MSQNTNSNLPRPICSECGDKLPPCDYRRGVCDVCNLTPKDAAKLRREMTAADAFEIAEKSQKLAGRIRTRLKTTHTIQAIRVHEQSEIRRLDRQADDVKRTGRRLAKARAAKKKVKGQHMPDGTLGKDDHVPEHIVNRKHFTRPHHYHESPQAYRTDGNPRQSNVKLSGKKGGK